MTSWDHPSFLIPLFSRPRLPANPTNLLYSASYDFPPILRISSKFIYFHTHRGLKWYFSVYIGAGQRPHGTVRRTRKGIEQGSNAVVQKGRTVAIGQTVNPRLHLVEKKARSDGFLNIAPVGFDPGGTHRKGLAQGHDGTCESLLASIHRLARRVKRQCV
jgi:hypothetical protein